MMSKKMTHSSYREYIAKYLLTTSLSTANCTKKKIPVPIDNTPLRLSGRHFISKFDSVPGSNENILCENVQCATSFLNNSITEATQA